jgi:hypothetical protein
MQVDWSPEEEHKLIQLHLRFGNRWVSYLLVDGSLGLWFCSEQGHLIQLQGLWLHSVSAGLCLSCINTCIASVWALDVWSLA